MNAQEIIQNIGKKYSALVTYQDAGTITICKSGSAKKGVQNFRTYFKRPCLYRYESIRNEDATGTFALWCDGRNVFRQSNNLKQQLSEHFVLRNTMKDLNRALSSVKEAQTIAGLLMENLSGSRLTSGKSFKLMDESLLEGETCYYLQSDVRGKCTDLWVAKNTLAVVKLIETSVALSTDKTVRIGEESHLTPRGSLTCEYKFQYVQFNDLIPSEVFSGLSVG